MIILLTDGMPNEGNHTDRVSKTKDMFSFFCSSSSLLCLEGESRLPKIQENVQSAIGGNMSLFCLGFGNGVDYNFLDVMSRQNKGIARRIFEGSDATLQLQVSGS